MVAHRADEIGAQSGEVPVATLKSLPRPLMGSAVGWATYWTMPDRARRQFAELGDRFVIDLPLMPKILFTTSVEDARSIYMDGDRAFDFTTALVRISPHERVLGPDILDAFSGETHADVRRLVAPAFRGNAIRGYERAMVDATRTRMATWPISEPVQFHGLMKDLARDVIMSVVFGVTDPERVRELEVALKRLNRVMESPGMMIRYSLSIAAKGKWLPFPALDKAIGGVDSVVFKEVAARKGLPNAGEATDCLSIFLRIRDDDPSGFLDDQMLAAFMRLLLLAGYETTAATLAWTAERLVRHPEVMARLDETLAAGDASYLDAVIAEAMRVRPVVPFTVRLAERDSVLNGVQVPAGTLLAIYINAIHKRADIYPEPGEFNPDRFANSRPDPRHWMPFGGGAHYCLGAQLSLVEARVLMRTILEKYRFAPETEDDERQDQHRSVMTLPRHGALVTLLPR